ncbi:MAG TPA: hypothetical protein VIV60_13700 [Polyangiaceae bacterium]
MLPETIYRGTLMAQRRTDILDRDRYAVRMHTDIVGSRHAANGLKSEAEFPLSKLPTRD